MAERCCRCAHGRLFSIFAIKPPVVASRAVITTVSLTDREIMNFWVYISAPRWNKLNDMPITDLLCSWLGLILNCLWCRWLHWRPSTGCCGHSAKGVRDHCI